MSVELLSINCARIDALYCRTISVLTIRTEWLAQNVNAAGSYNQQPSDSTNRAHAGCQSTVCNTMANQQAPPIATVLPTSTYNHDDAWIGREHQPASVLASMPNELMLMLMVFSYLLPCWSQKGTGE